jgi:hypothetical protein
MTPPFTTMAPILFSGLMPSVSVAIDGPLSLVKEEKMRQLITTTAITNHPDYPAISGLLSFINPYHKTTAASVTTGVETPLSLSVRNSLTQPPVTANPLTQSHSSVTHSSHVPSLTRPPLHHNQSITSATTLVPTPPTAVPVSVVTSVVDQNRGLSHQRIKGIGQNSTKHRLNVDHNTSGMHYNYTLLVIELIVMFMTSHRVDWSEAPIGAIIIWRSGQTLSVRSLWQTFGLKKCLSIASALTFW